MRLRRSFPAEITHFNVTEFPIGAHYHWLNANDELAGVVRVMSDITPSPKYIGFIKYLLRFLTGEIR